MISPQQPIVTREAAKELGLRRYFTGIPCEDGHISERYTSGGQCCECNRIAYRNWYAEKPNRRKTERRDYYLRNRAIELPRAIAYQAIQRATGTDYYTRNRVVVRERIRLKRQSDPAPARAKEREIRKRNPDKFRNIRNRWLTSNPDWKKVKKHRRRARERAATGTHSVQDVRLLYQKQHGKCAICFKPLRLRYAVDHIRALSRGGSNDPSNLQLTHHKCNAEKWAKDPIDFARELGRLL